MRCKGCGYSLWNHAGRTCPECGRAFVPGDFEFHANAVEFLCGGCGQQYYGTGEGGLLEPREFACVRCGVACSMDAMVLRPAPGVADDAAELLHVPWQREGGLLRRFLATLVEALVRPDRLGRAVAQGVSAWAAFRFALCTLAVAAVPSYVAFVAIDVSQRWQGSGSYAIAGLAGSVAAAAWRPALVTLVVVAAVLAALALGAAIACWLMRRLGAPVQWTTAWGAHCYAGGTLVILAVPCCGPFFGWTVAVPWFAVSVIVVLVAATRAPAWKAATAVLLVPSIAALLGAAWATLEISNAIGTAAAPAPAAPVLAAPGAPGATGAAAGDGGPAAGDPPAAPVDAGGEGTPAPPAAGGAEDVPQ